MRSAHFTDQIQELVDGRLDARERSRLESHLESCAGCRRERDELAAAKAAVRSIGSEGELPESLLRDVRAALDREDTRGAHPSIPRRAIRITAAAAIAATVLALLFLARPRRLDPSSVARDWERIASGRLSLELRSDSPTAVSRFFSERGVGFPVPPDSLEIPGYRLVGARVHALAGRPSALYVYRSAAGTMLVCQMYRGRVAELAPGAQLLRRGNARLCVFRASGTSQVFWQDGEIVCALASDIAADEVVRIAFSKALRG